MIRINIKINREKKENNLKEKSRINFILFFLSFINVIYDCAHMRGLMVGEVNTTTWVCSVHLCVKMQLHQRRPLFYWQF